MLEKLIEAVVVDDTAKVLIFEQITTYSERRIY